MDEAEARAWVAREFNVPRETMARLDGFAALLRAENERQNLVSRASLDQLWAPPYRRFGAAAALRALAGARAGSIWAPAPAFPA